MNMIIIYILAVIGFCTVSFIVKEGDSTNDNTNWK